LLERSTYGVDGDSDLAIANIGLGDFKKFHERTDYNGIMDDWGEMEQSFVRRQNTELSYPVFSCGYLLPLFPCSRDNLIYDFVPSGNCQR